MASGAFAQAQSRVDAVLRARPSPGVRAAALVLAGDAAYGLGAYRQAAERYEEALLSDDLPLDAPHATLALGWAELRLGRREEARLTWMRVARQFPADASAPIALVLAAELSIAGGPAARWPASCSIESWRAIRHTASARARATEPVDDGHP